MSLKQMMFIFLSTLLVWNAPAYGSTPWIAFSQDGAVFVAQLDGQGKTKLAEGYDPEISPDGKQVAFTAYSKEGDRTIAVVNRETRNIKHVTTIPGKNSYGPRWSPEGSRLLVNHWDDVSMDWVIGLMDMENDSFTVLIKDHTGLYSPFWSHDGRFAFAQDLENLLKIDISANKLEESRPLSDVIGESFPSSAVHFSYSPDGERLLFDCDVEADKSWSSLGEPLISAIFMFNLKDGKTVRLTDRTVCATKPSWLPTGKSFIFSGYTPKDVNKKGSPFSLYLMDLNGGKPELLLKGGSQPSSSR
ncbi:TolB family protein [Dethiosulfovibrio salsuginis]|uniref:WD40-like Beta Propeller Repeat n=1 Tax=Dethiosulfovibrio salsuginis TaxID=561720 RepID=A0A1X7KWP4_9BACT|nr:PD40 domain-containing protein [Dethiosulfovibrio salsuginis]SMG45765.1 WD40-like Beta Propeller Repeat [Dethiosulfovibrio salsuginis]